jgi:hypothetical protein
MGRWFISDDNNYYNCDNLKWLFITCCNDYDLVDDHDDYDNDYGAVNNISIRMMMIIISMVITMLLIINLWYDHIFQSLDITRIFKYTVITRFYIFIC